MTEVSIKIYGIDCAACVRRLSRALTALDGVLSAQVSYTAGTAQLCYDARRLDIAGIAACVKKAGFTVPMETALIKCKDTAAAEAALCALDCVAQLETGSDGIIKAQLWPIGADAEQISLALGMPAEVEIKSPDLENGGRAGQAALLRGIFMALFFSLPQLWDISAAARMAFGTLTLLGCAYFYRAFAQAVKKRLLSPDAAAAVLLTALYALCAAGAADFLLLTAAAVLLLVSRCLEKRAVYSLGAAARRLSHMQPRTARVLQNGKITEIASDELRVGDIAQVLPGERFPADGELISGECLADCSAVTGETELIKKQEGDTVLCGTLDRDAQLLVRLTKTGKDTVLQRKISGLGSAELPRGLSVIAAALGMSAAFTLLLRGKDGEK